jgi:type VII secretion integral membrane protein EccD
MAAGARGGFTKATVATDSARVDLALPHAASLGELLPELLRLTGAAPASAARGWELSRLGQPPLDCEAPVADLGLFDGELIYLAPRALHPRRAVFDDVADAIGEAAAERAGNWTQGYTRTTGLVLGAALLLAAAAVIPLVGGGVATACGFSAAAVLTGLAAIASRAFGDAAAGAALAALAAAFASASGYAVLGPHGDGAARMVMAAAVGAAVAALGLVVTGDYGYVFTGLILVGAVGVAAGLGSLLWHAAPASIAAFTVAGVVLLAPLGPLASLRLAGVALPTVPGTVAELRAEAGTDVDGETVVARARRANDYHSALVISAVTAVVAATAVIAARHDVYGRALCLCAALALCLRARLYTVAAQRLALLLGGSTAFAVLVSVVAAGEHTPAGRAAVALGALGAAGAAAFVSGLVVPGRHTAPYWGRALDWLETLALTAIVPLAVAVPGWYAYFHGLAG